jgi:hypothetical protein
MSFKYFETKKLKQKNWKKNIFWIILSPETEVIIIVLLFEKLNVSHVKVQGLYKSKRISQNKSFKFWIKLFEKEIIIIP